MMRGIWWLSWKHMRDRPIQTGLLALCLSLPILLPLATQFLVTRYQEQLIQRASDTPLLLGAAGNRFDLTLATLYFRDSTLDPIENSELDAINRSGHGYGIPLRLGFRARGEPIAAVGPEYFEWRGLRCADGKLPFGLGEATLGSEVAKRLKLSVGDHLYSDPREIYNLATPPSLKMPVVGVLKPRGTPDDHAVFVDLNTAWVLEGFYHGHQDAQEMTPDMVINETGTHRDLSPAMVEFNEITDSNRESFHYHGDRSKLPLSSVIVIPKSDRGRTILKARWNHQKHTLAVIPLEVIQDILGFVFKLKQFFDAYAWVLGLIAAVLTGLILWLSSRLRRKEVMTLNLMGAAKGTVTMLHTSGLLIVLMLSLLIAGLGLLVLRFLMPQLTGIL